MTLHLKSRGYPFRPRLLFSCFIVVGVGFPNCVLFQERTQCASLGTGHIATPTHEEKGHPSDEECPISGRWLCVGLSLDDAVERRRAVRKRHL